MIKSILFCPSALYLRHHISEAELIFTALAELFTRQIAETMHATGMPENKVASKTGGGIAKKARLGPKIVLNEVSVQVMSL